jgi:hypothetical protein
MKTIEWALMGTNFGKLGMKRIFIGTPQGSPTSPFLSVFAESRAYHKDLEGSVSRVAYADDGILYSDVDFSIELGPEMKRLGVVMAPEKSA